MNFRYHIKLAENGATDWDDIIEQIVQGVINSSVWLCVVKGVMQCWELLLVSSKILNRFGENIFILLKLSIFNIQRSLSMCVEKQYEPHRSVKQTYLQGIQVRRCSEDIKTCISWYRY